MSESAKTIPRMTVEEFLDWSEGQPGRHELFMGEVVTMQSERQLHNSVKLAVAIAFRNALAGRNSGCRIFTDGIAVRVDRDTAFEPDASIACGPYRAESVLVDDPVVVVEVISPSTSRIDTGRKFGGYFQLSSVHHYLIIDAGKRVVVHHRRHGKKIESSIVASGALLLEPPAIVVQVEDFFADLPPMEEEA